MEGPSACTGQQSIEPHYVNLTVYVNPIDKHKPKQAACNTGNPE